MSFDDANDDDAYFVNIFFFLNVNIFTDADFCCNLKSPTEMVSNQTSFKGYPGRSHSRGPLKIFQIIFSYIFVTSSHCFSFIIILLSFIDFDSLF